MAIDKAIDSAVLEANLKAVADAIREKGGTSDTLAFPSGFADAIAAIEAGGGGFAPNAINGKHIFSEITSNFVLEQDFGGFPYALALQTTGGTYVSGKYIICLIVFVVQEVNGENITLQRHGIYNNSGQYSTMSVQTHKVTTETWNNGYIFTPTPRQGGLTLEFRNMTYDWWVFSS